MKNLGDPKGVGESLQKARDFQKKIERKGKGKEGGGKKDEGEERKGRGKTAGEVWEEAEEGHWLKKHPICSTEPGLDMASKLGL